MRPTASNRHRNRWQAAAGVSLFPFLAVLICATGALILLLVVIARQARLQAAQDEVARRQTEQQEDPNMQLEDTRWRVEQLKISRQKTETQLNESRTNLGHVEDHARRLRQQLARLEATWADLARRHNEDNRRRDELEAGLTRVEADIAVAEQQLADARRTAAERRGSYAVIPYRGPHETYRRPIYIECRGDAIILQPEEIILTAEDFDGPMGPGNPLAAALRAIRESLLARSGFDRQESEEPYPLLLVRPGGVAAYYAARAAMQSWASQFGYELIGGDWRLAFQPPDPELAEVMRRAIATARVRQQRLAAAAPRQYGTRRKPMRYRASPTRGGIVRDGGIPDDLKGEGRPFGPPPSEQPPSPDGPFGKAALSGEWQPSARSADGEPSAAAPGETVRSLATPRGRDWGLPDSGGGAVPITRPIRMECHRGRLLLLPERGTFVGKSIPLGPDTADSVDALVSAIWEHMQSWGIAGNGMYWRPVLHVRVAPGGEQRYEELSTLLDGSGLTLQKDK